MKKYMITLAALIALALSLGAGAAGAATVRAASAPSPRCIPLTYYGCHCPAGWQVKFAPYWQRFTTPDPWCVRK